MFHTKLNCLKQFVSNSDKTPSNAMNSDQVYARTNFMLLLSIAGHSLYNIKKYSELLIKKSRKSLFEINIFLFWLIINILQKQ